MKNRITYFTYFLILATLLACTKKINNQKFTEFDTEESQIKAYLNLLNETFSQCNNENGKVILSTSKVPVGDLAEIDPWIRLEKEIPEVDRLLPRYRISTILDNLNVFSKTINIERYEIQNALGEAESESAFREVYIIVKKKNCLCETTQGYLSDKKYYCEYIEFNYTSDNKLDYIKHYIAF